LAFIQAWSGQSGSGFVPHGPAAAESEGDGADGAAAGATADALGVGAEEAIGAAFSEGGDEAGLGVAWLSGFEQAHSAKATPRRGWIQTARIG
jgi:hypothetical protein